MKRASQYREALGLTQEEAAQLLKIPKSMLGMFEIGQRDLPAAIKLQLLTLYNLVQNEEQLNDINRDKKSNADEFFSLEIKKELLEYQYKQQFLERKLEQLKVRFQKSEKQIKLVHILETQVRAEDRPSQDYIDVLKSKAEKERKKNSILEQKKLELKIKGLISFQKELEKEVKKYQK